MNVTTRLIVVFLTIVVALLAVLFVFDAIDLDTLTDNLVKVGLLALIAMAAAFVISLVNGGNNPTGGKKK